MSSIALERFKRAQDDPHSGFSTAAAELRAGRKSGHWIWYIFPQLSGLGMSEMSRVYALADAAEAIEYLHDPILRSRLLAAATAVVESHRSGLPLERLMGSRIDTMKLVSSMTLFAAIAGRLSAREKNDARTGKVVGGKVDEYRAVASVAAEVLAAAEIEGYPACAYTLGALNES